MSAESVALKKLVEYHTINFEKGIVNKIQGGKVPPPLKPATIKRKGHDKTLLDSTDLLASIGHKVEVLPGSIHGEAGVMDARVETYAIYPEYGVPANLDGTEPMPDQIQPTRSFIRSTADEMGDEEMRALEEDVGEVFERRFLRKGP